jgi:uncharacterized Ntn-hydrolase superfamily protein
MIFKPPSKSSVKNYSVQANFMLNDKVWPLMSTAFENTKGDLAERASPPC